MKTQTMATARKLHVFSRSTASAEDIQATAHLLFSGLQDKTNRRAIYE